MSRIIPEIKLNLKTIEVKGESRELPTIKELYCKTFWGKIKTFLYWLFLIKNKSYKKYINSKITYSKDVKICTCYNSSIPKEIEDSLENELKTNGTTLKTHDTKPIIKYKK